MLTLFEYFMKHMFCRLKCLSEFSRLHDGYIEFILSHYFRDSQALDN